MAVERGGPRVKSAAAIALAGLAALAVAMGIGRFAFTPLLPMMQHDRGLTLAQGGWLASANYLGYFLGALYAMRSRLPPARAIMGSLLVIAVCTLGAAATGQFAVLLVLRLLPGIASALVLVHVSAWALEALAAARRPDLGGAVFSGVGVGIVCAGVVCAVLVAMAATSTAAWIALGVIATIATAGIAPVVRGAGDAARGSAHAAPHASLWPYWRLIFAHAAFGFGYIIPATFLPVMARHALGDSPLFGWAWPVFGTAAAISTLACTRLASRISVRATWAASLVVMALGVGCPVVLHGLAGIVVAALAVGATFMSATMLAMLEARRIAAGAARPLMAAMTTAFALGQIAGPLAATGTTVESGFGSVLVMAAGPLIVAAYLLARGR
ncbi:MAG TPA: YbfB/YjiJ family MFS transporter [Usitatibacter sp.]|nr:YbfB/YjiJ family MFS transporter [Usitatibacter sp.]